MQFATNHLGHFLLTNLLIDVLKNTEKSRIINVSALGHINMFGRVGHIHFDDLQLEKSYEPLLAYT